MSLDFNKRYHSIDFLKGVCIIFVILTHYDWSDAERLFLLFPFWINMAVPIFMIISGFVYAKSFVKHKVSSMEIAYSPSYIIDKIVRYTIPYAMVFIVEVIVFSISGKKDFTIFDIILSFVSGGFGPGGYYYPIMIQFIFVFPIIYFIIRRYDFSGLVLCFCINFIYELLQCAYELNVECYGKILFRYIMLIAFGCYIAIGEKKFKNSFKFLSMIIGVAYIILFVYLDFTPLITRYWTGTSLWACLYILPIAVFLLNSNIHCVLIELIGKASYNIYLFQMVYYCAKNLVYAIVPNRILQVIVNVVICCVMGLIFYYIEQPITNYLKKRIFHNAG